MLRIGLKGEKLQVDGNFALMCTGWLDFSVAKSTRSLLGTLTSGEGLLQTFRGTGSVLLAPTQEIYQRLQAGGMASLGGTDEDVEHAVVHHSVYRPSKRWRPLY